MSEVFESVREALPISGKRVAEVTCDDWAEVCAEQPIPEDRVSRIYVHFSDGTTLTFWVSQDRGFEYDGYPDGSDGSVTR